MATTDVPVQTITEGGLTPAAAVSGDNTNGNSFVNTGVQWVEWTNTGGSTGTVTVAFGYTVKGQTIPAKSYSIAAAAVMRIGPFDPAVYGSSVVMTPSAATIKPAAFQTSR